MSIKRGKNSLTIHEGYRDHNRKGPVKNGGRGVLIYIGKKGLMVVLVAYILLCDQY